MAPRAFCIGAQLVSSADVEHSSERGRPRPLPRLRHGVLRKGRAQQAAGRPAIDGGRSPRDSRLHIGAPLVLDSPGGAQHRKVWRRVRPSLRHIGRLPGKMEHCRGTPLPRRCRLCGEPVGARPLQAGTRFSFRLAAESVRTRPGRLRAIAPTARRSPLLIPARRQIPPGGMGSRRLRGAGVDGESIFLRVFRDNLMACRASCTPGPSRAAVSPLGTDPPGNRSGGVRGGSRIDIRGVTEYQGDFVVVGKFITTGGVAGPGVSRWDGAQWSALRGWDRRDRRTEPSCSRATSSSRDCSRSAVPTDRSASPAGTGQRGVNSDPCRRTPPCFLAGNTGTGSTQGFPTRSRWTRTRSATSRVAGDRWEPALIGPTWVGLPYCCPGLVDLGTAGDPDGSGRRTDRPHVPGCRIFDGLGSWQGSIPRCSAAWTCLFLSPSRSANGAGGW